MTAPALHGEFHPRGRWWERLTPALGLSFAVHGAIVAALLAVLHTGPATEDHGTPALAVVLTPAATPEVVPSARPEPPPALEPVPLLAPVPVPTPAVLPEVVLPPPQAPAPAEAVPAAEAITEVTTQADPSAWVEFSPTAILAQAGDYLQSRSMSEFPAEIDRPVRTAGTIDVAYPPAALEERREATVVAWVIVDAAGQVEEVAIAVGDPEFGEPVQNALLTAKFLPAEDRGVPIRYFTMLEFRFRLGGAEAVGAAGASGDAKATGLPPSQE